MLDTGAGPTPWDGGVVYAGHWGHPLGRGRGGRPRNTPVPICNTVPNFVVLGQTIWAQVEGSPKIWKTLGPRPV